MQPNGSQRGLRGYHRLSTLRDPSNRSKPVETGLGRPETPVWSKANRPRAAKGVKPGSGGSKRVKPGYPETPTWQGVSQKGQKECVHYDYP